MIRETELNNNDKKDSEETEKHREYSGELLVASGAAVPSLAGAIYKSIQKQHPVSLRCMGRWSNQQAVKAVVRATKSLEAYGVKTLLHIDVSTETGRKYGDPVDVTVIKLYFWDGKDLYDTLEIV